MNKLQFFILFFIPVFSIAQGNADSVVCKKSSWSFNFAVGPTYAFHTDNTSFTAYQKKGKLEYGISISAENKFCKLISMEYGLSFDKLAYINTFQYYPPTFPTAFLFVQTYNYSIFSAPISLKINFGKKKFKTFVGFGPQVSRLISNKRTNNLGEDTALYYNHHLILLASVCLGTQYKINNHIKIFVGARAVRALTPIKSKTYIYFFGNNSICNYLTYLKFNIGLTYNF